MRPPRGPGKADTPRKKAKREGRNTYMGRPCPKGHSGLRRTGSMDCIACALAYGQDQTMKRQYEREKARLATSVALDKAIEEELRKGKRK